MQRVCRVFGMARSTAYYLKAREAVPPGRGPSPKKRGPVGAGTDEVLVGHIRTALADSPSHGEGYRKVWARPRHRGIRTASERARRLMREHHLRAPRRDGDPHGPRAHDGTIITEEPDTMRGTDMTTTVTAGEGTAHVFVAVGHCTCECAGLHAARRGNRFEALEPLRQGVREHLGRPEAEVARGLAIRHDHGSNYLSGDSQGELRFLGMAGSPSFVREPEGNGCAERFIRTLKEDLLWVRVFATVSELVDALGEFKRTYNERWPIRRHGHRTPSQVRRDLVSGKAAAARVPSSPRPENPRAIHIDAMGCQAEIAEKILERKADYVLAVKGNRPTLHEGIIEFFPDQMEDDFARVKVGRHETKEKGHGRIEHRTYYVCDVPDDLPDAGRWAGLERIGVAISDTVRSGKSCDEVRYYILSKKVSARCFGAAVRSHWSIENSPHWQLDMSFGEDRSRVRKDHADANMAALRRLALGLLKNEASKKVGIKNKRLVAAWNIDYLRQVLFGA